MIVHTTELNVKYFPLSAGIKISAPLPRLTLYTCIAPGIQFTSLKGTNKITLNDETYTWTQEEKYKPAISLQTILGAKFSLNERVNINLEITPYFAFAYREKLTYTYQEDGYKIIYIYQKDTSKLPDDEEDDQVTRYRHGQRKTSFSSIGGSIGISFNL